MAAPEDRQLVHQVREPEIWLPTVPRPELPLGLVQPPAAEFPSFSHEDLRRIKAEGWARVGVVSAIIRESDGNILMLEHKKSVEPGKTPEGALGVMSETSRADLARVETTIDTIHRAVQGELGLEYPSQLELKAYATTPWIYTSWVVGANHEDQHALAVSIGLVVPDEHAARINPFINSTEIRRAHFQPVEKAMNMRNLRPGVAKWIETMQREGMLDPEAATSKLDLQTAQPMGSEEDDHLDVRFDQLDL